MGPSAPIVKFKIGIIYSKMETSGEVFKSNKQNY